MADWAAEVQRSASAATTWRSSLYWSASSWSSSSSRVWSLTSWPHCFHQPKSFLRARSSSTTRAVSSLSVASVVAGAAPAAASTISSKLTRLRLAPAAAAADRESLEVSITRT